MLEVGGSSAILHIALVECWGSLAVMLSILNGCAKKELFVAVFEKVLGTCIEIGLISTADKIWAPCFSAIRPAFVISS